MEFIMKNLLVLLVLSFSLLTLSVQASEIETTEKPITLHPTYNTDSDWWIEITPDDPDYHLYEGVQVNCFCG